VIENYFLRRAEKQDHIINAAFKVFSRRGYSKASIGEVAQEAGTTKGSVTHHFGSKKTLYLYLAEISQARLVQEIKEGLNSDTTDFFEKLKIVTDIQVSAIKTHPALINFMNSIYSETDPEVKDEIARKVAAKYARISLFLQEGTDFSRFKSGFNPHLISSFIFWANNGFMTDLYDADSEEELEALVDEFYQCLNLMQNTFCRVS